MTKSFDMHVSKSVPFYQISHNLTISISDYFLKNNSVCCDLGSSTGTLLKKIKLKIQKKIKYIGIQHSKPMVIEAKKRNKKIDFKYCRLEKIKLNKCDFITSLYTIQFIEPKFRQKIFNEIYKSLNWGGGFVLFEKIRASDARFQDIMTFLYFDFKAENGLKPIEILNKELSLRSVLEPFTINENIKFLKRAGFKDIMPISQYLCFKGLLAIK